MQLRSTQIPQPYFPPTSQGIPVLRPGNPRPLKRARATPLAAASVPKLQPVPAPLVVAIDAQTLFHYLPQGPQETAAFGFVQKLTRFNTLATPQAVELVLVCTNPQFDVRPVLEEMRRRDVPIGRHAYCNDATMPTILRTMGAAIYLAASSTSTLAARAEGLPAGHVQSATVDASSPADTLSIALDFDGVVADHEAQRVYDGQGLAAFHAHEDERRHIPMKPGPLRDFMKALQTLRAVPAPVQLRLSVVTARGDLGVSRMLRTLGEWDLRPDCTICLSGASKREINAALGVDAFFDDQEKHLEGCKKSMLTVHVPPLPADVATQASLLEAA